MLQRFFQGSLKQSVNRACLGIEATAQARSAHRTYVIEGALLFLVQRIDRRKNENDLVAL